MVANDISFYRKVMPQPWKEELLQAAREKPDIVGEVMKNVDSILYFFMEAMVGVAPWFPEVVTYERRGWLQNEFDEIIKDIRDQEKS